MSVQTEILPVPQTNSYRPFSDCLAGRNAFYNAPDYYESTQKDLSSKTILPVTFTANTEHIIFRIVKLVLCIIIFPIGIYYLIHSLAGKLALLPSSSPILMGYEKDHANNVRSKIALDTEWKYKRLTIAVDGYEIDAMIMGKESTLGNGRWLLASNGNGEFYEDRLSSREFKQIVSEIDGNAIVFNYPGVGASSGLPNRQAMAKAYRAMLTFLEKEAEAKEIIGYGYSMGGGVQGDALNTHELKEDVKYVFVKKQTFSDIASAATHITNSRVLGFIVRFFGWNTSSVESSKKLQAPEIIIQTANVRDATELTDSSKVAHDRVIPAEASLAKVLLDDDQCPKGNKTFFGIREDHMTELKDTSFLTNQIEAYLD